MKRSALAAMVRKKYDDAATQFQAALDASPEPATVVRLAAAYNLANKPDQAIAALDKLNTMPDVHPTIKSAAAQERNNAVKLKGGAGRSCKPATPASSGAGTHVATRRLLRQHHPQSSHARSGPAGTGS